MKKNKAVQGLRGIACLLVFFSHSYSHLFVSDSYLRRLFEDTGRLGVLIFFLLSGVLEGRKKVNQENNAILAGYKNVVRKIKKMYPLYLITTIFMFACTFSSYVYPEWLENKYNLIFRIVLHCTLLQSYIPKLGVAYSFNGPAWFLSACMLCWFLTPVIKKNVLQIKRESYLLVAGLLYITQIFYLVLIFKLNLSEQRWFMYVNPFFNLSIYVQGILCGGGYTTDVSTEGMLPA